MKKIVLSFLCVALLATAGMSQTKPGTPAAIKALEDTVQYSLGIYMMQQVLAKSGFQVTNPTLFKKAIDDYAAGKKMMIDPATAEQRLLAYQQLYYNERQRILAEKMFAEVKKLPQHVALPSGVMYTMLSVGNGAVPTLKDTVIVNVNSKLPDGTVIDDVSKSKQSFMMLTSDLIPGLRDVVTQMKEGAICRAFIPASQAYGSAGKGAIPPNSALIYEIALVSVKPTR